MSHFQLIDDRKKKNMERRATSQYVASRYKSKAKKYQQKEGKEYTYGLKKEKMESKKGGANKEQKQRQGKKRPRSCVCLGCGRIIHE